MDLESVIEDLKTRKEQFVTGHSGSSIADLRNVTLAGLLCNAGWIIIVSRNPSMKESYWLDFLLNWVALLCSVTIFGENPLLTCLFPLLAILLLGTKSSTKTKRIKIDKKYKKLSPTLTFYRSSMLVLTSFAILAVDFPVFPRKYAKVETWGISLMDLGVGSFVFSNGIISYIKLSKDWKESKFTKIKQSIKSTIVLMTLGLIRLVSVKVTGYQEHVTEYGIHWNFFFTLSLLPIVMIILDSLNALQRCFFALVGSAIYEICLIYHPSFLSFLLYSDRLDLISANREGIFSFIGYCTIYLFAQQVGGIFFSKKRPTMNLFWTLFGYSILSVTVSCIILTWHPVQVSRRFATLGYSSMVISFNLFVLTCYFFIVECITTIPQVSHTFERVNDNGMMIFLVSNVTTGMINFTFNTLDASSLKAMTILTFYAFFISITALYMPFKLKF